MAKDHGIKVVQAGASFSTTDVREILLSSKFSMLKYHSDQTNSVTVNGGDTEKYLDFTHSLGYVPAFIAYYKYNGRVYFIPNVPRSGGYDNYGYAYADTSKVRCGIVFPNGYNKLTRTTFDTAYDTGLGSTYPSAGKSSGGTSLSGGWTYRDIGAAVGDPITIPQGTTISSATCDFFISDKGSTPGDVPIKTVGIDVDDVSDFGNDMGQPQTTAETFQSVAAGQGTFVGISVTSIVQEIVNRGGWANGNNLGFYIFDNGASNGQYISTYTDKIIKLYIVKSGTTTVEFRCIIFKDKIA